MATLKIDRGIDKYISKLQEKQFLAKTQEEHDELGYKIELAESYKQRKELDFKATEIRLKKPKGSESYVKAMRALIKNIPGLSYSKRDDVFVARATIRGEQKFIGNFNNIAEGVENLREYVRLMTNGQMQNV